MAHSRDTAATRISPGQAPAYMQRMVGATLARRGFDGAEAGALAEMERLLEHHIQKLFETAQEYAELAGRATPYARDLLQAQESSGWDVRSLRKEGKRKRVPIHMPTEPEPPTPPRPVTLSQLPEPGAEDVKPQLKRAPDYAWDGAPPLPEPWTFAPGKPEPPPPPPSRVTAGVLDFIKLTATERGDIPPELGLVDYRRADGRETRRKWGVKGVGA